MIKRKIKPVVFCLLLLATAVPVFSQNPKLHFASYNMGAFFIGSSSFNGGFQTVNGIRGKKWFVGIGAGMDYYYYRTLPVFMDAKFLLDRENKIFIYGDAGWDIPWRPDVSKDLVYYDEVNYSPGVYTDAGIGFNTPLFKHVVLSFSAGHSYKSFGARIGTHICGVVGPCTTSYSNLSFDFGRIVFKMGIQF